MSSPTNILKWAVSLGREPQSFLGARWVRWILDQSSGPAKRKWALRLLALSPHYFLDPSSAQFLGMDRDQYLEMASHRMAESRGKIYEFLLKEYLKPSDTVLDYGCGPGFLAHAVAPHVDHIYACDISNGAIACAQVLNRAPNLDYLIADERGFRDVPDEGLSAVFSFAVVQHVSDDIYRSILDICQRKLKPGGRLILHIQLTGEGWRTESEWRNDRTLNGRLRYRYGLHCFARSEASHRAIVESAGFANIVIARIADLIDEHFDDICSQHLLTAVKSERLPD